jgi:hemerythrin-like metal-binding protein
MALIMWINDYSVGVDTLDADHIVIVSLMNHIDDLKQAGTEEEAVGTVLKVLLDFAYTHFRREEGFLKRYDYSEFERHWHEHRVIEEQLEELHEAYARSPDPDISQEILELLNFWLIEHILKVDMRYKEFLRQAMD